MALQVWMWRGVAPVVDLAGYDVEAVDGSIGTVDEATSQAGENYLVVDTGLGSSASGYSCRPGSSFGSTRRRSDCS